MERKAKALALVGGVVVAMAVVAAMGIANQTVVNVAILFLALAAYFAPVHHHHYLGEKPPKEQQHHTSKNKIAVIAVLLIAGLFGIAFFNTTLFAAQSEAKFQQFEHPASMHFEKGTSTQLVEISDIEPPFLLRRLALSGRGYGIFRVWLETPTQKLLVIKSPEGAGPTGGVTDFELPVLPDLPDQAQGPPEEPPGQEKEKEEPEQPIEEPAPEEPTAEPAPEEPIIEEPIVEEPVVEEPIANETQPAPEEPVIEEPIVNETISEPAPEANATEPVPEEPVVEEPVTEEPVIEEPLPEENETVAPEPILPPLEPGFPVFFDFSCEDTCLIEESLDYDAYNLVVEIESGELWIEGLQYSLEPVEEAQGFLVEDAEGKKVKAQARAFADGSLVSEIRTLDELVAGTYDIEVLPEGYPAQKILVEKAQLDGEARTLLVVDSGFSGTRSYALEAAVPAESVTVEAVAEGEGLLLCDAWNIGSKSCSSEFIPIRELEPGRPYSIRTRAGSLAFYESGNFTLNVTVLNITEVNITKLKEDLRYEVLIDSVTRDESGLTVVFHHDYSAVLPIIIDGDVAYTLDRQSIAQGEQATIFVPNYADEYFRIKVGTESEVLGFGNPREFDLDIVAVDPSGAAIAASAEIIDEFTGNAVASSGRAKVKEGKHKLRLMPSAGPVKSIEFRGIDVKGNIASQVGIDDTPESGAFSEVFAIDPTQLAFTDATVIATAKGTDLYKCAAWDFSSRSCPDENWTYLQPITKGQDYTIALTPADPGFAEFDASLAEGEVSTNAADPERITQLNFTRQGSLTRYLVIGSAEVQSNSSGADARVRVIFNDTHQIGNFSWQPDTSRLSNPPGDYVPILTHHLMDVETGVQNLSIEAFAEAISQVFIRRSRAIVLGVSGTGSAMNETGETFVTISPAGAWVDFTNVSYTPAVNQNLLVLATAELSLASTSQSTGARLLANGTIVADTFLEGDATSDIEPFATFLVVNASSGVTHNFTIQGISEGTANKQIRRARLSAVPLDDVFYNATEDGSTTTSAVLQNKTFLYFSMASARDALVLASLETNISSATNGQFIGIEVWLDNTLIGNTTRGGQDVQDHFSFVTAYTASLASGGHTARIGYRSAAGTSTIGAIRGRIAVIPINVDAAPTVAIQLPANTTYFTGNTSLNFTVSDELGVSACWYSLDSGANTTLANCGNITFNASVGSHTLVVYANDTSNNVGSASVGFSVSSNAPPSVSGVVLSATTAANLTTDNLTVTFTASDANGDAIKNITVWYRNATSIGTLVMPFEGGSSATSTKDYTGTGNGTVSEAAWSSTSGYDGWGAYTFDGINDYIYGMPNATINRDEGTIQFWAKANSFATPQMLVWAGEPAGNGYGGSQELHLSIQHFNATQGFTGFTFWYGDNDLNGEVAELRPGENYTFVGAKDLAAGQWYHVAVTWKTGNETRMYINGTLVAVDGTIADPAYLTSSWQDNLHIGRPNNGGTPLRVFNGTIDEVRIYRRALSAEQVSALYQNRTAEIVEQETQLSDVWSACVTPNDKVDDGSVACSNNLTIITDTSAPAVSLGEPQNSTYGKRLVAINFTVNELAGVSQCWYSLDGGANATLAGCANTTLTVASDGFHTLRLYANDTAGNIGSATVNFSLIASTRVLKGITATSSSNIFVPIGAAVHPGSSALFYTARFDSNAPNGGQLTGRLYNSTHLEFSRPSAAATPIEISWYVAEFFAGASVYRGRSLAGSSSVEANISTGSAVNASASFIIPGTFNQTGTSWGTDDYVRFRLLNTTHIGLVAAGSMSADDIADWQVVELNSSAVQRGNITMAGADVALEVNLSTAVVLDRSFMLFSYTISADTTPASHDIRGRLLSASQLLFTRNASGVAADIAWEVVELPAGNKVQFSSDNFTEAEGTKNVALASVNVSKTIAFASSAPNGGQSLGEHNFSGDDNPGHGKFTLNITSAANLELARTPTASIASVSWFVVEFNVSAAGGGGDTTAPSISFVSPTPANNSVQSSTTIVINVSHTEANPDKLLFYIDGVLNLTQSYSGSYTNITRALSSGVHNFSVTANDTSGNSNSTGTRLVTIDLTGPVITFVSPTPASGANTTQASASINITTSEAASAAILEWNGTNETMAGSGTAWNKTKTGLADGTYSYKVYANDSVNNFGVSATRTLKIDATAPSASYISPTPANNSIQNSATVVINISHTEANPDKIALYIGGTVNETRSYSGGYTNFTKVLSDGVRNYSVTINDTLGNSASLGTRFVTIDTTNPSIALTYPPNNAFLRGSIFDINGTASDTNAGTIVTNDTRWSTNSGSYGSWAFRNTSAVAESFVTVRITANDTAGNSLSVTANFTVDNTAPTVSYVSPTPASGSNLSQTYVSVNITTGESANAAVLEWNSVNESMAGSGTNWNKTKTGLSDGTYSYKVYANDSAGNLGVGATRTVTIDTAPPNPSNLTETPADPATYSSGQAYTFNATWTDAVAVSAVLIEFDGTNYTASKVGATSAYTRNFTNLAAATYSYKWHANDTAGNRNITGVQTYTISKAATTLAINITPSSSITFGTQSNASCTANNNEVSVTLTRNSTGVSNPDVQTLAAGSYLYNCSAAATQNYTSASTTSTLTVNKAAGGVDLKLNGTDSNLTVQVYSIANHTATRTAGEWGIEIRQNGALIANGSSPQTNLTNYTSLGTFNITGVYPESQNYTRSTDTLYVIVQDTIVPVVTLSSPANGTNTTSISNTFVFSAADNFYSTLSCTLFINSTSTATNSSTQVGVSTSFSVSLSEGTKDWYVTCTDGSSNAGSSATRTLRIDLTAPTVAFVRPIQGDIVGYTVTLDIDPADNLVGVDKANYTIRNSTGSTVRAGNLTGASYQDSWNSATVADGAGYNFTVAVNDTLGNTRTSSVTFTVDNTAPFIQILQPAEGSRWNSSFNINISYQNTRLNVTSYNITNSTGSVVQSNSTTNVNAASFSYTDAVSVSSLADGNYTISAYAKDIPASTDTVQKSFIIDKTAPQYASLTESPADPATFSPAGNYQFNATWTDNFAVTSVTLEFDGVNYTGLTKTGSVYNKTFSALAAGTYSYKWYALDETGNQNVTATQTYTISKAAAAIDLKINGLDGNQNSERKSQANFTATLTTPASGNVNITENNASFGSGASPITTSKQYNATGSFNITANYAGSENYTAAAESAILTIQDTVPPSTVSSLAESVTGLTYITWAWANPSDDDFDHVEVWVDGSFKVNTSSTSYNATGFTPGTAHTISTRTVDSYGNIGSWVNDSATTQSDTEAPAYSGIVESPSDPATYSLPGTYQLNITWTDNYQIGNVTLEFNAVNYTYIAASGSVYSRAFANLSAGTYSYRWYANDTFGNTNNSGAQTYTVSKAAGGVDLVLNGANGNITIEVYSMANHTATRTAGEWGIEIRRDGALIANGSSPLTNLTNYTAIGTFNITAAYTESQNYTRATDTHYVIVQDTTAPAVSLSSPVNGYNTTQSTITFQFTATDLYYSTTSCGLYIDSALQAANSSTQSGVATSLTASSIAEGSHTWFVNCTDSSGNYNATPSRSFIVDSSAPAITHVRPTESQIVGYSVVLDVDITDSNLPVDKATYQLRNASGLVESGNLTAPDYQKTWNSSLVADGAYTFNVTANDTLGNTRISIINFTVDNSAPFIQILRPLTNTRFNSNFALNITYQNTRLNVTSYNITNSTGAVVQSASNTSVNAATLAYNDLVSVSSLPDGNYTVSAFAKDVPESTDTEQATFIVDRTVPAYASLIAPADPSTFSPAAAYTFNATWTDAWGVDTVLLEFNGANYTVTKVGDTYTKTFSPLAAAVYSYKWHANDTAGNSNNTGYLTFTISKAATTLNLTASPSFTVTYPSSTNVSCVASNTEVSVSLTRNSSGVSNPDVQSLAAGVYGYNCTAAATQNYTSASSADTLTVNRAAAVIDLKINGLDGSVAAERKAVTNFTATITTPSSGSVNMTENNSAFGAGSSPLSNSKQYNATGSFTIAANYAGSQNYTSATESATLTIQDTTPPASVSSLGETAVGGTYITWSWTNPSDDDFDHVEVYIGGVFQLNTSASAYNATGLQEGTTYNISTRTADIYGNVNPVYVVDLATTLDVTKPEIKNLTEPSDPATYSPSATYQFTAVVTDNINVSTVRFEFDGANYTPSQSGTLYTATIGTLAAATYSYKWHANDTSGNQNLTAVQTFTVSRAASAVNLTLNSQDNDITIEVYSIVTQTATRLAGEGSLQMQRDGSQIASGSSPLTNLTNYTSLATFNITAIYPQTENYSSSSETHFVTVQDTTAPVVSLTSPADELNSSSTSHTFVFTATDNFNALLSCTLFVNSTSAATNSSTQSGASTAFSLSLSEGTKSWYVRCSDSSGNNGTSATRTLRMDTTAPTISFVRPVQSEIVGYTVTLDIDSTDNLVGVGSGTYIIRNSGGSTVATGNLTAPSFQDSWNSAAVADGSGYNFSVTMNDTVGNSRTSSVTFTVDNTKPYIQIIKPANNTRYNSSFSLNITYQNTQLNVTSYNITNSTGAVVQSNSTTNVNAASFAYTDGVNLAEGNFTVSAFAKDIPASTDTAQSNFIVDKTAPQYSGIVEPSDPATYSASANYQFNVTWTDNYGVTSVVMEFAGTNHTGLTQAGSVYNKTFSALAAGTYTYKWYASDATGNQNVTASNTFTVNKASSGVDLLLGGTSANFSAEIPQTVNITGTRTAGESLIEIYRDGAVIANGSSPLTQLESFSTEGTFNVTLRHPGTQNFTSSYETHYVLADDTTAPSIALISPADSSTDTDGTVAFQYNVSDTGSGIASCSLYINGVLNQTNSTVAEGAAQGFSAVFATTGSRTWRVDCTDTASPSNSGTSATRTIIIDLAQGVNVLPAASKDTNRTVAVTHTLVINNTGAEPDNFTLTLNNIDGASTANLNQTFFAAVPAGQSRTAALTVTDSDTVGAYRVNVTATSAMDPAASDTETATTNVYGTYTATLTSPTSQVIVDEGLNITFRGRVTDEFSAGVSGATVVFYLSTNPTYSCSPSAEEAQGNYTCTKDTSGMAATYTYDVAMNVTGAFYNAGSSTTQDIFILGANKAANLSLSKLASVQSINATRVVYNITLVLVNAKGTSTGTNITDRDAATVWNVGTMGAETATRNYTLAYNRSSSDQLIQLYAANATGYDSHYDEALFAESNAPVIVVPQSVTGAKLTIVKNIIYLSQTTTNVTYKVVDEIVNSGGLDLTTITFVDSDIGVSTIIPSLARGASTSYEGNVTLSKTSQNLDHTFAKATASANATIFESNQPKITIPGYGGPFDVTITSLPGSVTVGGSITGTIELINQNPDVADDRVLITQLIDGSGTIHDQDIRTVYVGRNSSATFSVSLNVPSAAGSYIFFTKITWPAEGQANASKAFTAVTPEAASSQGGGGGPEFSAQLPREPSCGDGVCLSSELAGERFACLADCGYDCDQDGVKESWVVCTAAVPEAGVPEDIVRDIVFLRNKLRDLESRQAQLREAGADTAEVGLLVSDLRLLIEQSEALAAFGRYETARNTIRTALGRLSTIIVAQAPATGQIVAINIDLSLISTLGGLFGAAVAGWFGFGALRRRLKRRVDFSELEKKIDKARKREEKRIQDIQRRLEDERRKQKMKKLIEERLKSLGYPPGEPEEAAEQKQEEKEEGGSEGSESSPEEEKEGKTQDGEKGYTEKYSKKGGDKDGKD
jgi:hypothetical protein